MSGRRSEPRPALTFRAGIPRHSQCFPAGCCGWESSSPSLIVAETVLVRVLASVEPHNIFGMVYLLGVLVISAGWDIRLGVLTTFVSAAAYLQSHLDANSAWPPASPALLAPLAIFLPIALLANALCGSRPTSCGGSQGRG